MPDYPEDILSFFRFPPFDILVRNIRNHVRQTALTAAQAFNFIFLAQNSIPEAASTLKKRLPSPVFPVCIGSKGRGPFSSRGNKRSGRYLAYPYRTAVGEFAPIPGGLQFLFGSRNYSYLKMKGMKLKISGLQAGGR